MSSTPDPRRHRQSQSHSHSHNHAPRSDRERSNRQARASTPPLPPYEPPIAALNAAAHNAIINLLNVQSLRQLKTHVQRVEEKLTDSAGEVNERLTDARVRYQKERTRKRKAETTTATEPGVNEDEIGEEENEELNRLAQLEGQVRDVTEQLETRMRRVIDAEVKIEGLAGVLADLGKEAEEAAASGGGGRGRRRTRRRGVDDSSEDDEATPEREREGEGEVVGIPLSRRLDEKLHEESTRWEALSLTQRYSTNNTYVGFYRIVHDAKHPGDDIPPVPHASTWFAHMEEEDPSTTASSARRTRGVSPPDDDEDDITIKRERISLKCPLTLLPFRDPVTSTKCPHTFERDAISDMIAKSSTTVPAPAPALASHPQSGRSRRVRSVKCPVCSVVLTAADLRSDPVLLRRVRRAEAVSQREAEDEEFDEGGNRRRRSAEGRKSGVTVASDDDGRMETDGEAANNVGIKQERALSQAQNTLSETDDDE